MKLLEKSAYGVSSDEDLVGLIAAGNRLAFDEIYKRYAGRIHYFFLQLFAFDKELASDRTQDVFLKLLERANSFDSTRRFSSWLYAIAFNLYKNDLRKTETEQRYLSSLSSETLVDYPPIDHLHDHNKMSQLMNEAMCQLDPDVRIIFLLRFVDEHTVPEISRITHCPEGTVKSRLFYALKKLSKQLEHLNISDWI